MLWAEFLVIYSNFLISVKCNNKKISKYIIKYTNFFIKLEPSYETDEVIDVFIGLSPSTNQTLFKLQQDFAKLIASSFNLSSLFVQVTIFKIGKEVTKISSSKDDFLDIIKRKIDELQNNDEIESRYDLVFKKIEDFFSPPHTRYSSKKILVMFIDKAEFWMTPINLEYFNRNVAKVVIFGMPGVNKEALNSLFGNPANAYFLQDNQLFNFPNLLLMSGLKKCCYTN